jgi:hypothetical protein
MVSLLLDRYGQSQGKPFVGYKVGSLVRDIPILHNLWSQAKFVQIIRDGRDVCLSAMNWRRAPGLAERFATWEQEPVTTAAIWWEWNVRLGREAGSALGPELYYEIRYEALVAQPEAESADLCSFLGVPHDGAMLRFHEGRQKDDPSLSAKHAWRPITRGLRDWRTEMAPEDVERFEAAAGSLLDELGYPRSVAQPAQKAVEHAARLRSMFEGRPLPETW